jgi:hypothetical protein
MSHLVVIEVSLKNQRSVVKACERLEWKYEVNSSAVMYDGSSIKGVVITIPDWKYPAVVQDNGQIGVDTFNNRWGSISDLDRLKQYYAVEETQATLRAQGLSAYEYLNEKDGSITLTAEVHH